MTVHFDTLAYTKKLIASGVEMGQAEAQAEALSDVLEQNYMSAKDTQYLVEHWSKDLKHEMADFRTEVREEIHDVKTDVAHVKVDVIRWFIGIVLAQTALIFSASHLLH